MIGQMSSSRSKTPLKGSFANGQQTQQNAGEGNTDTNTKAQISPILSQKNVTPRRGTLGSGINSSSSKAIMGSNRGSIQGPQ